MFVGHLAVALAARRAEPRAPLPVLVASSFALDILWPVLLLLGIETVRIAPGDTAFTGLDFVSYPWSHSLSMAVIWGIVGGRIAVWALKSTRAGLFVALAIVSHWVLDFVTHRPDLPLFPGGPQVGLGLWNSIPATIAVEGALLAAGVALYATGARSGAKRAPLAFWSLIVVTTAVWISGPWAPPPPNVTAIAIATIALAIVLLIWTWWIERASRSGATYVRR